MIYRQIKNSCILSILNSKRMSYSFKCVGNLGSIMKIQLLEKVSADFPSLVGLQDFFKYLIGKVSIHSTGKILNAFNE